MWRFSNCISGYSINKTKITCSEITGNETYEDKSENTYNKTGKADTELVIDKKSVRMDPRHNGTQANKEQ